MSTSIEWTWHRHPLLLCQRTKSDSGHCFYCGGESTGPMYACKWGCGFLLHKRRIEIEPTMIHPHHPDHPLTLHGEADGPLPLCEPCLKIIHGLFFSCKLCAFRLHAGCTTRVPTRKHYLHEHELLRFDEVPSLEFNRCGTSADSPLFRCVPCNFNLHEKYKEFPRVVKSDKIHWHPLILQETFFKDDSGEYYCDEWEKRRDGRLGVYMCGKCKISIPRTYHIECVLPELRKVYAKNIRTSVIEGLAERTARKNEEIRAAEGKLEEMKQELDEVKKRVELISEEEGKN